MVELFLVADDSRARFNATIHPQIKKAVADYAARCEGGKQPYFFVSTDDGGNYRCINPGAPNLYQMLVTNYTTTFEEVRPLLKIIHKANSAIRGVVPPVEFAETSLTTYSKGGS